MWCRLLWASGIFVVIMMNARAHVGEPLENLRAKINPASITGDVESGPGFRKLLWKRDDGIYSNVQIHNGVVDFEQFSKYDGTDLSRDEADKLMQEERPPNDWKFVESKEDDLIFVNAATEETAIYFSILTGGNHPKQKHFLNINHGLYPSAKTMPKKNGEEPGPAPHSGID